MLVYYTLYKKAPKILGIEEDALEREALRRFILSELRRVRLEFKLIMVRYGVSSIEELVEKIKAGGAGEDKSL